MHHRQLVGVQHASVRDYYSLQQPIQQIQLLRPSWIAPRLIVLVLPPLPPPLRLPCLRPYFQSF